MAAAVIVDQPQVSGPELDSDEPIEAHIVMKNDQMRGYVEGQPIMALCGKIWVPGYDPTQLPVCERCKAKAASIVSSRGGAN